MVQWRGHGEVIGAHVAAVPLIFVTSLIFHPPDKDAPAEVGGQQPR